MRGRSRLTIKKGDQLLSGALGAQGEGNSRESVDGIEAEKDIVVLLAIINQGHGLPKRGDCCEPDTAIPSIRRLARRWGRAHRWSWSRQPWRATVGNEKDVVCRRKASSCFVVQNEGRPNILGKRWAGRAGGRIAWAGCDAMGKWVRPNTLSQLPGPVSLRWAAAPHFLAQQQSSNPRVSRRDGVVGGR